MRQTPAPRRRSHLLMAVAALVGLFAMHGLGIGHGGSLGHTSGLYAGQENGREDGHAAVMENVHAAGMENVHAAGMDNAQAIWGEVDHAARGIAATPQPILPMLSSGLGELGGPVHQGLAEMCLAVLPILLLALLAAAATGRTTRAMAPAARCHRRANRVRGSPPATRHTPLYQLCVLRT